MRLAIALLVTAAGAGFTTAQAQQPATLYALPPQPASCPVSLSVQQRSATELVRTNNLPPQSPEPPAQRLDIAFKPHPFVEPIDAIELRVRGVGSQRQSLPLALSADGSRADDLQQTFTLRRSAGTSTLTRSEIRVLRMNAIRWVELVSVTYADGTMWRPAANLACRTEPNRLLLVSESAASASR